MANILWSFSTTIRNPERIPSFFKTITEMEGEIWNNTNQKKFQILLIKNRFYCPEEKGLSPRQISVLNDLHHEMTFEEAEDIFISKGYNDPAMRGRMSFDPLEKVGLVYLVDKKIVVSEVGRKYASGMIEFGDVFFNALIKQQYPNPLSRDNVDGYNIKPFIAVLHVIKMVNEKWQELGNEPVGISKDEFGIFCLSIKRYTDIPLVVNKIISFRQQVRSIVGDNSKRDFINLYLHQYLQEYPQIDKKLKDYRDNMLRCIRLTKLIYIRGNGYYIDLEPRRMVELNSLLENDNASAKVFNEDEWKEFIGSSTSYVLPWETPESLVEIQRAIISDINGLEKELGKKILEYNLFDARYEANQNITKLREIRLRLLNERTRIDYSEISRALEVSNSFDINVINRSPINRPSIELERLSTLALNVIDDAIFIKPNYPVGDDNEPTWTAPSGVPDIECFYETFNLICEVTMLATRDQWVNEGQPVMRHLREFEERSSKKENYCLFIAPIIHIDTLNTFWFATKYEYDGKKQKIVPITIIQMRALLDKVVELKKNGSKIYSNQFKDLLDECTNVYSLNSSSEWREAINNKFENWINSL